MGEAPLTVLFLSTGNAARSILAEAVLNHKGSTRFVAQSAGLTPLPAVDPETIALLQSQRFEVESLHPKNWDFFQKAPKGLAPDIIVTLSEAAREHCTPWPESCVLAHWVVDDPLASVRRDVREWKMRKCFATLEARIAALLRTRLAPSAAERFLQLRDIGMVV